MKKIISLLLSSILVTSTFNYVFAEEKTEDVRAKKIFYVAPYGDDNNTGTEKYPSYFIDEPLSTINISRVK